MDNKIMKLSDFLNSQISPFILGAFFSRYIFSTDKKYIATTSFFKETQKVENINFDYNYYKKSYTKILNDESKPNTNWINKEDIPTNIKFPRILAQSMYILENDLNIKEDSFFNNLYSKLFNTCAWIFDEELTEDKKKFIRGYFEIRGSIDTTANYITQDYFYNSQFEAKKARLLVDYLSIPYYVTNINFRELQKQYYEGITKRNTQFRLNIFWYMYNIGLLNEYKAKIFSITKNTDIYKSKSIIYSKEYKTNHRESSALDERLHFYSKNVFDKVLTKDDIFQLRTKIGLNKTKFSRKTALVELIKLYTPDECMCCKNDYNINERTIIDKNGKPFFEIHHVISLGQKKELDDENNLVKLCPLCHTALKKGRSSESIQKEMIKKILNNAPNIKYFAEHFFDIENENDLINAIYLKLN